MCMSDGAQQGLVVVTKPYEFIGFGAMEVTTPYKFIGFGAMEVTKPYEFIRFAEDFPVREPSPPTRGSGKSSPLLGS